MNLYELTSDLNRIDEIEDNEEIKAIIQAEIQNKSSNIIKLIRNKESKVNALDEEIKRLQEIKRNEENKIKYFKEYIKACMETNNISKIETGLGNITLRKSPVSLKIIDETKIPEIYLRVIEDIKVDKKAIIDYFKDTGEMLEGIQYITENKNIMIK